MEGGIAGIAANLVSHKVLGRGPGLDWFFRHQGSGLSKAVAFRGRVVGADLKSVTKHMIRGEHPQCIAELHRAAAVAL